MTKERGPWYERQLERARQKRAEAAALRPPRPPGIRASGRYREYNREWMRAHYQHTPRPPARPKPVYGPIPDIEDHPLVVEAVACLRPYERAEIGGSFDSCARDLIGEYVLAALSGADPLEAMRKERARYRHDRAALVFGTSLVDGLDR